MFSGSQIIVECLKRQDVHILFAYPGATSMCLHHDLISAPEIRVVLPRHEQGGVFAAEGFARRTGKAGVCLATSGPGATNLVTGIADAFADSIPLVVLTCQVKRGLIGKNAFQETDVIGMTRSCVKHSYLALSAEVLPQIICDAFYLAEHGRPGPIVIDIPLDILTQTCEHPDFSVVPTARLKNDYSQISEDSINRLRELLSKSRRPCIFAGGGIISAKASSLLRQFAEKTGIPVTTSLMGIGAFPENHPLSLKFLGMHGSYSANRAVQDCDLLLGISVRFSDRVTGDIQRFAPHATIVHVDIDNSEINKNKHADLAFVCDARVFLERMLKESYHLDFSSWIEQVNAYKKAHDFPLPAVRNHEIHIQHVIKALNDMEGMNKVTLVTGVGQHQMWTAQFFTFTWERQLLTSGGLGAMGFGLPTAIGALMACPDSPVLLIDGDGSFQMNIQELATVFLHKLPLKMIIMNNQNLGMVAQWEKRFFDGCHANTDLRMTDNGAEPYPDFCRIADGYGIPSTRISRQEDISPALEMLMAQPGSYLLEIITAHLDMVLPAIPAGKTCEDIILE